MSPLPCHVIFQISQPGFGRSEDSWCSAEERQRWYSQYNPHEGILLLSQSLLYLLWTAGVKYVFLYKHLEENCKSCALQDLIFMSSSEELAARKEHCLNTDCITEPLITQVELTEKGHFQTSHGQWHDPSLIFCAGSWSPLPRKTCEEKSKFRTGKLQGI